MKRISVSTINHNPTWDFQRPPPRPEYVAKRNLRCLIYYKDGTNYSLDLWNQVEFLEDRTEDRDVPDGQPQAVEFFWEETIGGFEFRRMAWYDRELSEQGKPWGWLGIFWLFDSFKDSFYERTACGIALTKFHPPEWPRPDDLK